MSNLPQKYVDDKTPIAVSPLGGGADDWDNIFGSGGIAASAADQGKVLLFTDGYYLAKTAQSLPSNISIEFSPNVLIVSSIAPAGSFPGNYVYHLDAPSSIQTGSLAATPAIGSTSLSVSITSKPTVGNYLQLTHGVSAAVYKVVAASGVSSPWTITIDRSTNLPWTSTAGGDAVDEYASHPSDIKFNAAGKIAGTGDQLVQIVRTSRYWMSGLNFVPDGGFPTGVAGFDLGCRDCGFEDCILDLTGSDNTHGSIGFFAQSTEHAIFRRLRVKNAAVVGAEILDCFGAQVEDCHFEGGGIGVSLSSFGANDGKNSFGSYFCTAINGTAVGSVIGAAVAYVGASYGCAIENYATIACTSFGIYVGAGGIATRIINCDVSNSDVGILVQSGAQDTKIVGLRADNCTTVALSVGSALDLTGMTSTVNYSSNGVINFSGTDVWRVRGLDLTQNNNNGYLLYVTSPGRLEIDGAILQGSCAVGIFINAATTVVIRNTKITAANQGIFVASGATLIVGEGVDLSGCTSPFTGTGKVIGKFNDVSAIAMTTADHTATWAEYAVDTILLLGTLGTSRNLVLPKISFNWLINNGTDQTVTVKGSTGTGIAIPSGATARVFFNGTNFVISTATVFEGTVAQFNDTTPDEALRLALNGAGATSITAASGVTAFTINQTDLTSNSGVGASLILQAQNETGTTSTGGKLVLGSGSGTSTNGAVQFNSGTTTLGSFSLNSTTDWRMTLDSGLTNLVFQANGPSHTMVLQALDGSGSINIQAPTVVYYDNIPTEAFRFNLSSNGSTSLVVNGSVTSFNINYNQMSGTGSNNGGTTNINAQAGQNQSGANNNNPGGDVVISGGSAGTGGSGSAGAAGGVTFFSGITQVARLEISNIGFGATNYLNFGVSGGIRASNIVSAATSGDAYYIASGHVYLGTITDPTAWGFSSAGLAIEPTQTATISQTVVSSTGSNSGLALTITSQAGQAQTGSNNNNNGGSLILQSGAAGTGGSGTAGTGGAIAMKIGATPILQYGVASNAALTDLDTSLAFWFIRANAGSQGFIFQALGGNIFFDASNLLWRDSTAAIAMTTVPNATGTTSMTIAAGVTGFALGYADNTVNSATASPLNLFGQNATGTSSNGGDINIGSGKGTSTNGKIGLYAGGSGGVHPGLFELKSTSLTINLNSVTLLSFDTGTGIMAIGDNVDTSHADLFAGGSVRTWTNSVNSMAISDTLMALGVATVAFTSSVAAPKINQSSISTTNGTGQALTIQGQNETGSGGSTVGGALNLTGGTGNTNGKVQLQDGGTTIATVGGSTMTMASGVFCKKINVTNSATGSITIDMSTGNIQEINMTGNITTLTFSNLKTGSTYTLAFIQDAGTGSHTLSLPAAMHVSGGTFTLTSNKGIRDNITLYYDGTVMHEVCRSMNITN